MTDLAPASNAALEGRDRRTDPRVPVRLPAGIAALSGAGLARARGVVRNLSRRGLAVEVPQADARDLRRGDALVVTILVPGRELAGTLVQIVDLTPDEALVRLHAAFVDEDCVGVGVLREHLATLGEGRGQPPLPGTTR